MQRTLFDAAFFGDVDGVYRHIFEGADLGAVNDVGNAAIHAAAHQGSIRILELLVRAGANVNSKGCAGNTALHYACKKGNAKAVQALLDAGADPSLRNGKGYTPKELCVLAGSESQSDVGGLVSFWGGGAESRGTGGASLDAERREIVELLDTWVLRRCSFLGAPKTVSTSRRDETNVDDVNLKGRELLDSMKPLIEGKNAMRDQRRNVLPGRPFEQLETTLLHTPSSIDEGSSQVQETFDLQTSTSPRKSPLSSTTEDGKLEKEEEGFYVEIDGEQVFVPLSSAAEDDSESVVEESDGGKGAEDDTIETTSQSHMKTVESTDCPGGTDPIEAGASERSYTTELTPSADIGLGIQLAEAGSEVKVNAVHPAGPAGVAGIQTGDILTHVNGESTSSMLVTEVKALISRETTLHESVELILKRP